MTEAELIAAVAEAENFSKANVKALLTCLGNQAAAALGKGEEVPLPGLGKLKPALRAAREGRNPKTGAALIIPPKLGVKFVASKTLRDYLNGVLMRMARHQT